MKNVIGEYADVIVAMIGAVGMLRLFEQFFLGKESFMANLLRMSLQGGL